MDPSADKPEDRIPPPNARGHHFQSYHPMIPPPQVGQFVGDNAANVVSQMRLAQRGGPEQSRASPTPEHWAGKLFAKRRNRRPDRKTRCHRDQFISEPLRRGIAVGRKASESDHVDELQKRDRNRPDAHIPKRSFRQ